MKAPLVLDAHGKHAHCVRFTKDGKYLVSAGQDGIVRLWATADFQQVGMFEGHTDSVHSLTFSSDESLLASSSADGSVRVWSFPSGECERSLAGQTGAVFSPKGSTLATIDAKNDIVLWDGWGSEQIAKIKAPDKRVTALAFSQEARSLLVGGTGVVQRFSMRTFEREGALDGHVGIACLRTSADGKLIASTSTEGMLRIVNGKNWKDERAMALQATGSMQIAFTMKGDRVSVSTDGTIRTFVVKTGALSETIEVGLKGVYGIAWSPDARYLANAAADGRVRIWES